MSRVSGPEAHHSRTRGQEGQRARRNELRILLLVAIQAFHRSFFALGILRLVAIDACALRGRGVVKSGLELGLHGWRGDECVTRTARHLRGDGRFLRTTGVVTHVAGRRALCGVLLVFKLHAAQRRFQDECVLRRKFRRLRRSRRLGWRGRFRRLRRGRLQGLYRGGQGGGARRLDGWRRGGSGNRSGLRRLRRGRSFGSSDRRLFLRRRGGGRFGRLGLRGSRSRLRLGRGSWLGLRRRRRRRLQFLLRATAEEKRAEKQRNESTRDDSHCATLQRIPHESSNGKTRRGNSEDHSRT
jgi:hypothetical protein